MLSRNEDHEFDLLLQQEASRFKELPLEEQARVLETQRLSMGRSVFPRDGR